MYCIYREKGKKGEPFTVMAYRYTVRRLYRPYICYPGCVQRFCWSALLKLDGGGTYINNIQTNIYTHIEIDVFFTRK